ncbi:MAG: sugar phosphate isomerase/epimerase family protein [Verrucomicrobiales bacterium]
MNRRQFLFCAHAPVFASALSAIEPIKRAGKPRLLTSLAAYSFRETFTKNPAKLDMFKFIDYCADHELAGAEVTSYYFPKEADDTYFLRLKHHAFLRGVALSGTAVGNNFALPKGEARDKEIAGLKVWIDRAALMGAPHIRVFAGAPPKATSVEEAMANCIEAIEECAAYAGRKGIFLGVENHGGLVAEPAGLLRIMQAVKSPWVGINLDTGNFHTEDPYAALQACAPYAVNVQVKIEISPKSQPAREADFSRLIKTLRDVNYQGFVALEYEGREDAWKAVPGYLEKLKALCA